MLLNLVRTRGLYLQDKHIKLAVLLKPLHSDVAVVWVMTGDREVKQSQAKRDDLLE